MLGCNTCETGYTLTNGACICSGCTPPVCTSPCLSCNSEACLSCPSTYVLYNKACTQACPQTYYPNFAFGRCLSCNPECRECTSENFCTMCMNGNTPRNGNCTVTTGCQPGFGYVGDACVRCPSACLTCLSLQCTQCEANYILIAGLCQIINCDIHPALCGCNSQCTSCKSWVCSACSSPYLLYSGTCVASCPEGFYISSTSCQACVAGCTRCSSSATCEVCAAGFVLDRGTCVASCTYCDSCPLGSYKVNQLCVLCPTNCEQCASNSCTKCKSGYDLLSGSCVLPLVCPDGQYKNTLTTC